MRVCYVPEPPFFTAPSFPQPMPLLENSLFLAGPTPREAGVMSWRPRALQLLKEGGFNGTVFVPETETGSWAKHYDTQVHWEWQALAAAACVVFWVPREMATMPALTTNVEFGFCAALKPERMVLGFPEEAVKTRYLASMAKEISAFQRTFSQAECAALPVCHTLPETLQTALHMLKETDA